MRGIKFALKNSGTCSRSWWPIRKNEQRRWANACSLVALSPTPQNLSGHFLPATIQRSPNAALQKAGLAETSVNLWMEPAEQNDAEIEGVKRRIYDAHPAALKNMGMIAGTPNTVPPELKKLWDIHRRGSLVAG